MIPASFPQSNKVYGPPREMTESQVGRLEVFRGVVERGSCEGTPLIVSAWQPTPEELAALNAGAFIFVTHLCDGLPPHMLTTNFEQAIAPA